MRLPNGSLSSFDTCKTMNNIILDEIVVDRNRVYYNFSYSSELSSFFRTNQMFLEYEEDMAGVPKSILSIPFIASVIGVAWLENTNLYVMNWIVPITVVCVNCVRHIETCTIGLLFVAASSLVEL